MARVSLLFLAISLCGWTSIYPDDDASKPPLHWTAGSVVNYYVHSAGYPPIGFARTAGAVDRAFQTWELGCSTLRFRRDPNGRDGDTPSVDGQNIIRFETEHLPPEVDPRSVLAFTQHLGAYCTGILVEADITFNAVTVRWSDTPRGDEADIETVALHEIGHLIGFGHVQRRDAVMYPSIVELFRRDLSDDEENAICTLYARNRGLACDYDGACAGGEVCVLGAQSDESVEPRCSPALGAGRPGQRCNPNAESFCDNGCADGLCLNDGTCSTLCRDDRDCPGEMSCIPQVADGGVEYGFCINLVLCEDDANGCPRGQACTVAQHPSEDRPIRICLDSGGAGDVGAPCNGYDDCAGAMCLHSACTRLCDVDRDCPDGFPCTPTDVPIGGGATARVGLCEVPDQPCARPRDCEAGGMACVFVGLDGDLGTRCLPSEGEPPGGRCRAHEDCLSRLCLGGGVCSGSCRNDADCPEAPVEMVCDRVTVAGQGVPACVLAGEPPPPPPPNDASVPPPIDAAPPIDQGAPNLDATVPPADPDARIPPARPDGAARIYPDGGAAGVVRRAGGGDGGGTCSVSRASLPWPVSPLILPVLLLFALRHRFTSRRASA